VEILRMRTTYLTLSDLAEWEPAETMADVTLSWWSGPSNENVLQMLMRWRQLRRLTLKNDRDPSAPPLEVVCDFITEMKELSYLHISPHYRVSGQWEIARDKVNELILPRRPNFTFDISRIS
jgi:hypothetical protein